MKGERYVFQIIKAFQVLFLFSFLYVGCATTRQRTDDRWIVNAIRISKRERSSLLQTQVQIEQRLNSLKLLESEIKNLQIHSLPSDTIGLLRQAIMDCAMTIETAGESTDKKQAFSEPISAFSSTINNEVEKKTSIQESIDKSQLFQKATEKIVSFMSGLSCQSVALNPLESALIDRIRDYHNLTDQLFEKRLQEIYDVIDLIGFIDQWQARRNNLELLLMRIDRSIEAAREGIQEPYTVLQRLKELIDKRRSEGIDTTHEYERLSELEDALQQVDLRFQILKQLQHVWKDQINSGIQQIAFKITALGTKKSETRGKI